MHNALPNISQMSSYDNTIVIFTSDHGEWLGEHLRYGKGYPAHDCVSRVPLLIRWPNAGTARQCSQMVEAVDVLPTLLDCAGIQIPPHVQGRSLRPLLTGDEAYSERASVLMEFTGWKIVRSENFRYVAHGDGREFLYDLRERWGEYRDVTEDGHYNSTLAEHRHTLVQRLIEMERPRDKVWSY